MRSLHRYWFPLAWTLFSWGVCFCFCISAPAQPPEQPKPAVDNTLEADILLGAARNAVKLGDIQTAIERFRMFHQRYPDREDGRREYADALFQAGRADEAVPEYERLIQLHPDDPKLYRTLIDALLNVGDHPRAKKWLIEAMPRFPDRVDFALSLALFYALDEETSDAEEIIAKYVRGRLITSRRMLLDAASLYVQLRRPADAAPTIERLLQSDPDNARVLALSVRYALLVGDYQAAVRQSEKFDRLYPGNVDLRLELASALYTSGNYAEAGRLFADVLDKSPRNTLALLGCARVALRDYDVDVADAFLDRVPAELRGRQWLLAVVERDTITGNYLQAEQMLDRLLQDNPDDRQASMALADLYRAENEFIKADTLYLAEGATTDDPLAGRHYALSLYLQRRYTAAEKMCCHVLAMNPEDTRAMMLLARILVQTNRCDEARDWCRKTQETDNDVFSECMFFSRFVSPEFGPCRADPSRPVYLAATLFDLAMEAGRRQWAKKTLDEALRADPNNVVLRTRLAEWCASFGLPAQAACAAEIYSDLLARDPSNQKWMLGLARANVTMRCYDQALALYGRLRCESPGNYLYARETARVVFFVCGSPQGLAEYDAALCGWPGLREEARRLSKERWAKANHYSSPSIAACNYEALLALEPYEPHLAFELGQVRGMLGTTTDAIDAYAHLLAVNPNHRDAQIAIVGKELERCRELQYDHCFARERGRDGLTSIDRLGEYIRYQFPREDENEYLSIGYGRLSLAPTYGSGTTGNALAVRYQKQVHGDFGRLFSPYVPMAVFVDCDVEQYNQYVSTRPVFEAGLKLHAWNDLVCTVSGTMNNILENGESLQQDIYRGGLRTDLNFKPWNYWETEATYEYQRYSDANNRHAAEFRNRFQLTPDPRRLTLLADCYYWDIADMSVFNPGPDPFAGMLHPYWTPQDFVMGGAGIEWKEWLSWDRFDGARHCWVSFSAMKRWDNQGQNYTIYRGMLVWDVTRCLSGYALGEYDDGAPYRSTWAYGGLAWKF